VPIWKIVKLFLAYSHERSLTTLNSSLIYVAAHDFDRTIKPRPRDVDVSHSSALSAFTSIACCAGVAAAIVTTRMTTEIRRAGAQVAPFPHRANAFVQPTVAANSGSNTVHLLG